MTLADLASSSVSTPPPYLAMVGLMNTQPQQLSRESIDDFKAIYEEEFGEVLSDDEVQAIAMRLLRFFGILHKETSGSVDASILPR